VALSGGCGHARLPAPALAPALGVRRWRRRRRFRLTVVVGGGSCSEATGRANAMLVRAGPVACGQGLGKWFPPPSPARPPSRPVECNALPPPLVVSTAVGCAPPGSTCPKCRQPQAGRGRGVRGFVVACRHGRHGRHGLHGGGGPRPRVRVACMGSGGGWAARAEGASGARARALRALRRPQRAMRRGAEPAQAPAVTAAACGSRAGPLTRTVDSDR
jgi:hypothetical protein